VARSQWLACNARVRVRVGVGVGEGGGGGGVIRLVCSFEAEIALRLRRKPIYTLMLSFCSQNLSFTTYLCHPKHQKWENIFEKLI
jgi:hypothetical protein